MANELKITLQAALTNGAHKETFAPTQASITQNTVGAHAPVVTVGTSEEDLGIGDITTLGWLFLQNLDATNYVTYGPKDTTMKAFGRLEAGEFACLRLEPGITLRWQANTAPVKVKVLLLED
jgi:hypothetical protein